MDETLSSTNNKMPCEKTKTIDKNLLNAVPKCIILDAIDETFRMAIEDLCDQAAVGILVHGIDVSRNGSISVIMISTRMYAYLFDIYKLKDTAFQQGLKAILESASVLKVFHDCRNSSDALYHLYGTKLANVFDTQVADVLIYKNKNNGKLPPVVRPLQMCLVDYMHLPKTPETDVFPSNSMWNGMQDNPRMWNHRPLSELLIDALARNARHLIKLRVAMLEKLLEEFTTMVDVHLSFARDSSRQETEMCKSMTQTLSLLDHKAFWKSTAPQLPPKEVVSTLPTRDIKSAEFSKEGSSSSDSSQGESDGYNTSASSDISINQMKLKLKKQVVRFIPSSLKADISSLPPLPAGVTKDVKFEDPKLNLEVNIQNKADTQSAQDEKNSTIPAQVNDKMKDMPQMPPNLNMRDQLLFQLLHMTSK